MKRVIFPLIFFILLFVTMAQVSSIPNSAPIFCREMGYTVKNDLCIFPDGKQCNLYDFMNYKSNQCLIAKNYIKDLPCIGQGEYKVPGHICCNDLKEIKSQNMQNGTCKDPEPLGSWRVCSNCGNGVCDIGENECNCDKDCKAGEGNNDYQRLLTGCDDIGGYCRLWSIDCKQGFKESDLDLSYCFNSKEKCCVPTNIPTDIDNSTLCEKRGGKCVLSSQNCSHGYKDSLFGSGYCGDKQLEICCIKDNSIEKCPDVIQPNCPQGGTVESQGNDEKNCPSLGKCILILSNGRKAEIKVMPETASSKAIERLGNLGFNITLKEVGEKAVYEASTTKDVKVFGFIPAKAKVSAQVDAETGDIISTNKPWWSFLATGF